MIPVVGIGADGLDSLSPSARRVLESAGALYGSRRQLDLVRGLGVPLVEWPSPLVPALPALAREIEERRAAVLASGDPMFHGIGSTLARVVGPECLQVFPAPSSASLAAARLGWPLAGFEVHSCVTADPHVVLRSAGEGHRCLVLCRDRDTPVEVASALVGAGYGASELHVLAELGGPDETRHDGTAAGLVDAPPVWSDLCVLAVSFAAGDAPDPPALGLGPAPGLPDEAFETDGQLTKSAQRAVVLAALRPTPGALLWDVGGGTGTVGIEWMRCAPGARCVTVERDPLRAERIRRNASRLGVPSLNVVVGGAPDVLRGRADRPDAVFVGGGVTGDGVLDACWGALRRGGRLVAAAVTLESESALAAWRGRHGGTLTRIAVEHAEPLGGFTGWRPDRTVVQLACVKSTEPREDRPA